MHQPVMDWVEAQLDEIGPRERVVEIGSYDINGSVRPLFGEVEYTGIDKRPGPGVDVVGDGASWQPDKAPDTVICCEVLEHYERPAAIVANAHQMLAPGGCLLLTMAMNPRAPHSLVDGLGLRPDEHYANIGREELAEWLGPFTDVRIEEHPERGDLYAIARKPADGGKKPAKGKKMARPVEDKMLRVDEDKD